MAVSEIWALLPHPWPRRGWPPLLPRTQWAQDTVRNSEISLPCVRVHVNTNPAPLSSLNDWHSQRTHSFNGCISVSLFFKFPTSPPGTRMHPHKLLNLISAESNPNRPSQQFHAADMHVCSLKRQGTHLPLVSAHNLGYCIWRILKE